MSDTFRSRLRSYTAEAISEPGEHSRGDIAQAFLAENAELAQVALIRLAERQVDALIKEMCDADPDDPQLRLFDGLPAAIAVAPGVVKAIEQCTPEDLQIGEKHRIDNIRSARGRLDRYRTGVRTYLAQRQGDETVGDTARRLGAGEAAS